MINPSDGRILTLGNGGFIAFSLGDRIPATMALNWRTSSVDLLKLLGRNNSLEARRRLAQEMGYEGPGAGMNTWLHGRVMAEVVAEECPQGAMKLRSHAPTKSGPAGSAHSIPF